MSAAAHTSAPKYKYDFFVCHHHDDRSVAEDLLEYFEKVDIAGRKLKGYYDNRDGDGGKSEIKNLEEAIDNSQLIFLLLSKDCTRCNWYEHKVHTSLQTSLDDQERKGCVIPIYINIKKNDAPSSLRSICGVAYKESKSSYFWKRLKDMFDKYLGQSNS